MDFFDLRTLEAPGGRSYSVVRKLGQGAFGEARVCSSCAAGAVAGSPPSRRRCSRPSATRTC
jgi:hypothetical protein